MMDRETVVRELLAGGQGRCTVYTAGAVMCGLADVECRKPFIELSGAMVNRNGSDVVEHVGFLYVLPSDVIAASPAFDVFARNWKPESGKYDPSRTP